jgi:flagellar export protein FliJ
MLSLPGWLSTLIQVRRQHRDDCRLHLGEAVRAEGLLEERRLAIERQIAEVRESRLRTAASRDCDLNALLAAQRHQAALYVDQKALTGQMDVLRREIDRRQALVLAAEQQLSVLEKLAERKMQEAWLEAERREVKRLDELASLRQEAGDLL